MRQKVALCGNGLNLYSHWFYQLFTTQSQLLTAVNTEHLENIVGKGENAGNQHFLLFPQCFLLSQNKFQFLQSLILSSGNALNLDQSKILSFGKDLNLSQTSPGFYLSQYKSFENTEGKRRNCSK